MERSEAEHPPRDALDEPMILLKDIVQIFDLQYFDGLPCSGEFQDHIHGLQPRQVGAAFVNHDAIGEAIIADRALEETPRRRLAWRSESMKSRVSPFRSTAR